MSRPISVQSVMLRSVAARAAAGWAYDAPVTASSTAETTARDGTRLRTRQWAAEGESWARVLIVHGIAEHSGRYEDVGAWLSEAGLDVASFDLRGFGASGGRRAFVDRWSTIHDDLEDQLVALRQATPSRPVVLFGHSLGGL